MKRFFVALVLLSAAVAFGASSAAQEQKPFVPVTDEMLWKPSPSDWLSWRRTLDGHAFSPLDQVNRNNVARLKMMWTQPMSPGNQESTPLAYNGVLFVPNAGDYIQAFDVKTGSMLWDARRKTGGRGNNRNMAIWGTMLIDGSSDQHMYAIDARTGQPVWETMIFKDPKTPAGQGSGPIIANGKVISGRQCQPAATHEACVIIAHDAKTGKELWRTRTIPRPGEPGDETWGGVPMEQRWHVGTWMVPSYDPQTNLIIVGTSVTIPAPKFVLGGVDKEHLYHNSTLAINADTGKIVWHYQHVIDHWDLDHPFERILTETAVAPDPKEVPWINPRIKPGEKRRVVTGIPGKTGLVYTIDLNTGEFLWARPTVMQNVISRIDGATGKAHVNPEAVFTAKDQTKMICPSASGGKNWPAGAYNPDTNVMFFPLQNTCMNATTTVDTRDPSRVYGLSMPVIPVPGVDNIGAIHAISVETGRTVWKYEQRAGMMPLLATGGGLLFGGDTNGRFRAFDDRTGKVLWEVNLGAPVGGFPIAFAVDGKQYVAVTTGNSLVSGSTNRLTPEIRPSNAPNVFVFALP